MAIYGTNCLKFDGASDEEAQRWLARELHVVQPKIVVVMGQDARACLNAVRFPLATEVEEQPGEIQRFTPTIDALVTPDVDASLDEQKTKTGLLGGLQGSRPLVVRAAALLARPHCSSPSTTASRSPSPSSPPGATSPSSACS